MAIADRINEMYTHVSDVYDTITNVDLPTNKNIQNIPSTMRSSYLEIMNNGIDKIWNNWEKVTGSGTDISLSPTLEAPMKNVLNGNTYQFTTTGKNLLENTLQSQTANGITFTRNDDGSLTFSGTATQAHSITGRFTNDMIFRAGVTYIFSLGNKQAGYGVYLQKTGNVNVWYLGVSATNSSLTITPTEDTIIQQLAIHFPNGNTVNGTIYPMVRLSSVTDSTYEPYTGGQASPNPQYPQDIHIVSGDNTIKVTGKNLLQNTLANETTGGVTITNNSDGSFTIQGTSTVGIGRNIYGEITLKPGTYTFSANNIPSGIYISLNNVGYTMLNATTFSKTFTLANDTTYARVLLWIEGNKTFNNTFKVQLEKGSSATDYEPYSSNSYNIDLPVENLWGGFSNSFARTDLGVQFTANIDGTITANGTATNVATSILLAEATANGIYKSLPKGTYTVSGGGTNYTIEVYDKDNVVRLAGIAPNSSSVSFTISDTTNVVLRVQVASGVTINKTIKLQLEKGSKANSYTPYGTTPIELCNLNTYKDNFLRTSGKNLFDDTYNDLGMWVTNIGATTTFAQGSQYLGAYCKVEPGTYTISRNKKTNRFRIGVSPNQPTDTTSSCYVVASNDDASSITIDVPQGNNYICVYLSNNSETSTNVDLMIEKGSSATDYEPYGSGEWYLKQDTNKVLLNGTEEIGRHESANSTYRFSIGVSSTNVMKVENASTISPILSDKFVAGSRGSTFNGVQGICYGMVSSTQYKDFVIFCDDTKAMDIAGFTSWLTANNVLVRYVLSTPNYTKITYEPLLEQLEAYYHAKSRATQTNISQENNDLPFEIDASALKEWSV